MYTPGVPRLLSVNGTYPIVAVPAFAGMALVPVAI